ncbi:hypothetical protein J4437_02410 [Candidatus Woesearchaeota archaeon]|nr:hypothetical protein [Candidatus Woesearchaeota archaeon]
MFKTKKLWLKGGIIALAVCLILGLFYLFAYFPIIDKIYAADIEAYGGTPEWTTTIPILTGHFFPLVSHFILPYGFLCEFKNPICTYWAAEEALTVEEKQNCITETVEGTPGCCVEQTMQPTEFCANVSEIVGFGGLTLLLFGIYFALGAGIGITIQKVKQKNIKK